MAWNVYCCICGNSCKGCDFDYLHDEFKFNKINILVYYIYEFRLQQKIFKI